MVNAPVRSSWYETESPQASQVTRPASKSLDEDETPSCEPSGSSEALRLIGSLKSKEVSGRGAE